MMEDMATIKVDGKYSLFSFQYKIQNFNKIKKIFEGEINNLYIDAESFLKPIKGVMIC